MSSEVKHARGPGSDFVNTFFFKLDTWFMEVCARGGEPKIGQHLAMVAGSAPRKHVSLGIEKWKSCDASGVYRPSSPRIFPSNQHPLCDGTKQSNASTCFWSSPSSRECLERTCSNRNARRDHRHLPDVQSPCHILHKTATGVANSLFITELPWRIRFKSCIKAPDTLVSVLIRCVLSPAEAHPMT
jgi:hypothetical protein